MELLHNLGIDWKLLLAQIVNFLVLLFVLYKFAYGPVLKLLNERTSKIEKGLKDAEDAGKKLSEMAEKEKEVLVEARKEAQEIITKAEAVAVKSKDEIMANAKQQSEKVFADAQKKIETERDKMMEDVKKQVAELVAMAAEKVIGEKIDDKKDRELIEKAIE